MSAGTNPPKFQEGDRVKVVSPCNTKNRIGTVIQYISYPAVYSRKYVQVRLDTGGVQSYNEDSLRLLSSTNDDESSTQNKKNKEGANNMAEVTGNYRVAKVKFVQGRNLYKEYAFALFDNNVEVGDKVLCDTAEGYNVAEVISIVSKEEYVGCTVTKEIICKCDFTEFKNRATVRQQKKELKAQMDKIARADQDLMLYRAIAEKNPDMAFLLKQYCDLNNTNC